MTLTIPITTVFIAPHERFEAIDAYRDWLTPEQIDEITDASDDAIVQLRLAYGRPSEVIIGEDVQ